MLRIAICDDNIPITTEIETLLNSICNKYHVLLKIDIFFDGKTLCQHIQSHNYYDLIYLDIEMKEMNGIEAARLVRSLKLPTLLIYISSYDTYFEQLILLAFVHGITIFKFQHAHAEPATTYWILLLTTTISSILIIHTIFLLTQSVSSKSLKNLSSLSIIILLFLNITLFIIYNKLSLSSDLHTKNTVLQQQIHDYNDLIMQIKEHHSSYSCEKHNLKNQLIAIRSYAFQGQNKQIITFINSLLTNKDFGLTPQSYCTNIVLDSLLCSKRPLIQQFDITYTVNVSVPTVLPFDDIDLCIIIGNALDNAFESVTLNKIENPFVSVNIQYKNNTLYCHFQNTYVHKLHPTADFLFKSTKASSHHGYGLYSIQKTVTKYDGICKIFTEHEVFDLKILLYLPKPTSS